MRRLFNNFSTDIEGTSFAGRVNLFKAKINTSTERSWNNLRNNVSQIGNPYYDLKSHGRAFLYPFYHVTQIARHTVRLVYGAFVVAGALLTCNINNACETVAYEITLGIIVAIEVVNTALSILSLATRLVAIILNFGYASASIKPEMAFPTTTSTYISSYGNYTLNHSNAEIENNRKLVNQEMLNLSKRYAEIESESTFNLV